MGWTPDIIEFGHFETEDEFIVPLAESIRPHLGADTHLLFSYHGLPERHVDKNYTDKTLCKDHSCEDGLKEDNKFLFCLDFFSSSLLGLGPVRDITSILDSEANFAAFTILSDLPLEEIKINKSF